MLNSSLPPEGISFLVNEGLQLNMSFQHRSLFEERLAVWVEFTNPSFWGSVITNRSIVLHFKTHGFDFSSDWILTLDTVGKLIANQPQLEGGCMDEKHRMVACFQQEEEGVRGEEDNTKSKPTVRYVDHLHIEPIDPGSYLLAVTPIQKLSGKKGLTSYVFFDRSLSQEEREKDQSYVLPIFSEEEEEEKEGEEEKFISVPSLLFVGSLSFGFSLFLFSLSFQHLFPFFFA